MSSLQKLSKEMSVVQVSRLQKTLASFVTADGADLTQSRVCQDVEPWEARETVYYETFSLRVGQRGWDAVLGLCLEARGNQRSSGMDKTYL